MNATDSSFENGFGGRRVGSGRVGFGRVGFGRGAEPWVGVEVPVVFPEGWFVREVEAGIVELERVRRAVDAAMAVLVAAMPENRDSVALLSRRVGVSNREARVRRSVAKVVRGIPGALELLRAGKVSAEHLAGLASLVDEPGVEGLLAGVEGKSPETLSREVEQFRLGLECGDDVAKRQRAQRFVRFSDGPDGMVALHGNLPPLEGADLKATLVALVNARYRAEHPVRAEVSGGHGEDTRDQRMADALLEIAGIRSFAGPGPGPAPGPASGDTTGDTTGPNGPNGPDVTGGGGTAGDAAVTHVQTGKPAHVIVFNVDKWEANLAGGPAIPVTGSLFDTVRHELYLCFTNMTGEPLKFGRARRYPSAIQTLAVITRDQHCVYPGCHVPPDHCEIHHTQEVHLDRGPTNTETLALICTAHHQHLHTNNQTITRNPDGTTTVKHRTTGHVIAQGP